MTQLISQDRPVDQKYNLFHSILGEQLFKLTAIDMKTALIKEMLENPRSKTTRRALKSMITSPSSSVSMRSHLDPTPVKISIIPDDPPQDVNKPHLSASISTITNLDVTCTLDTSFDHLLHLDSPSHSSEPQDTSSVESVKLNLFMSLKNLWKMISLHQNEFFSSYHDYDLFLLNQEIDTPSDNLNHQDTHICENQDVILIHATNIGHTFALPQFMAQHNCEDLIPTDTLSTVPTTFQAFSDHTFNLRCAHNLMETQCNQPQSLTSLNKICAHNPSASQNSQVKLSNSLVSPYPPDLGEHVLKRSATETGEQNFPVKWFKFICPSSKPRMNETPVQKPVHVAYSPIASLNYQWTINLHDGYPPLQVLLPEEYIPPSLYNLCNFKPTLFHLGDDYFCPTKTILPLEDSGERLLAKVTKKGVEVIKMTDGQRFQNLSNILGTGNGKVKEIIYYSQLMYHQETAANKENETNDDLSKLRALIGHQRPSKAPNPNLKKCKYNVHVEWETGEKTYEPLSVLVADDPVTWASHARKSGLSHIVHWTRFKNLAKRDKHDFSCITSPKGR